MIIFRTEVFYVPPSPLGLVGNRWVVQHRCTICHQHVPGDQLVTHTPKATAPTTASPSTMLDRASARRHHRQPTRRR